MSRMLMMAGRNAAAREEGSVLVLTALMLTALLGITALAIDLGSLYDARNRMAAAADAAARSGAFELKTTSTPSVLTAFGRDASSQNGFTNGTGGVTVTINNPPASGPFAGSPAYVEAIVSQPVSTYFMGMFGYPTMTVGARAVAGGPLTPSCITALGTANDAVKLSGSASLTIPGCTLNSEGGLSMSGSSFINADPGGAIHVDGPVNDSSSGNPVPTPTTGSPGDPYSELQSMQPYDSSTVPCANPIGTVIQGHVLRATSQTKDADAASLQPGIYCGGLRWSGSNGGTLAAGTYIVYGGGFISSSSGLIQGNGVTIFNTSGTGWNMGSINLSGGSVQVNLVAPTSGTYAGVLFFQDPDPTTQSSMNVTGGSTNVNLTGLIYVPKADVNYSGGSGSSTAAYTFFVSKTIEFTGPSYLKNNTSSVSGGIFQNSRLAE